MDDRQFGKDQKLFGGKSTEVGNKMMDFLDVLRMANDSRQKMWDPDQQITATYRALELAGEVGEACNIIKKLERERLGLIGSRETIEHLAEELGDIQVCTDLVAAKYGINLREVAIAKFNAASIKHGFPQLITDVWK